MKHTPAQASREKMQRAGADEWQIERFLGDLARLDEGGFIEESELEGLSDPVSSSDLPEGQPELLRQTVILKLNGGLGTSMGLEIPKSLVEVREGRNFLDLVVEQVEALRRQSGVTVPLVLMHSFHTQEPCLQRLAARSFDNGALGLDFVQSQVPKLRADDRLPVAHPANPALEWCPPGHGEIYAALRGTGWLQRLLESGYRYAFVSNIDNLGATMDLRLLNWFVQSGAPFAMEVTRRTPLDKKGGHLARRGGQLILRERAQCRPEDLGAFEDIERHRFFNTNNLWLDLQAVANRPLPTLPLIINRKTVDPTDRNSAQVLQLESAMGAAISAYPNTTAVAVPRDRFLPVKTLSDLFLLRSDLYRLTAAGQLERTTEGPLPSIELDPKFFGTYAAFAERLQIVPGLQHCHHLRVHGDFHFQSPMQLEGDVTLSPAPVG